MFQNFDAPSDPVTGDARLTRLRKAMASAGVDALLVPHGDEQRNEYLPPSAENAVPIGVRFGRQAIAILGRPGDEERTGERAHRLFPQYEVVPHAVFEEKLKRREFFPIRSTMR